MKTKPFLSFHLLALLAVAIPRPPAAAQVPNGLKHSLLGAAIDEKYGHSVAVSGTLVVVGAPMSDQGATDAGQVRVYDLASATPTMPIATLNNPDVSINRNFGIVVAIDGTRIVVGTYGNAPGAVNAGRAFVYNMASATPTVPVTVLNNPTPAANEFFGVSVAISGTRVAVGAYGENSGATNSGSAYVFDLNSGTPTVPIATLNNPAPGAEDLFGGSVAISGPRVVVGAYSDNTNAGDAGSAYVYDVSSATPNIPTVTLNNPAPGASDLFGASVSISGMRVVVGAHLDDAGAVNAGSAYVYDLASGTPDVPVQTLNNPNPVLSDTFGASVAISGPLVVVGIPLSNVGATDGGIAYVYDLGSGTPTVPAATLNNPSPAMNDQFGFAVAIDATTAIIGAPLDDTTITHTGAAYVFGPVDTMTQAPTLIAPASSTVTASPVGVSFTLPEAALPGSVTLSFGATVLTLANSQATAGPHAFTFNPANPTASAQIASGPPLVDGSYTVTLSYQDALGNPAAASTPSTNVLIDTTGPTGGTFGVSPPSPVITGTVLTASFASWTDGQTPLMYSVRVGGTVIVPAGSSAGPTFTLPAGTHPVTGRITDALGNFTDVGPVSVTVLSSSTDTDGDGLNDAGELLLTALGFDWQISQTTQVNTFLANSALSTQTQVDASRQAGRDDVINAPNTYSLYTLGQVQGLNMDVPLLTRDAGGQFKLTIGLRKSVNLITYDPLPFTAPETTVNGQGKVEFLFSVPGNAAFLRLEAQ